MSLISRDLYCLIKILNISMCYESNLTRVLFNETINKLSIAVYKQTYLSYQSALVSFIRRTSPFINIPIHIDRYGPQWSPLSQYHNLPCYGKIISNWRDLWRSYVSYYNGNVTIVYCARYLTLALRWVYLFS